MIMNPINARKLCVNILKDWINAKEIRIYIFKYRAMEDGIYEQYRKVQEVFYKGILDGT